MAVAGEEGWLVAERLARRFGRRMVVDDVSLAVQRGEAALRQYLI